eukprot:3741787-Heterocapsa_arctica.AAC.1
MSGTVGKEYSSSMPVPSALMLKQLLSRSKTGKCVCPVVFPLLGVPGLTGSSLSSFVANPVLQDLEPIPHQ